MQVFVSFLHSLFQGMSLSHCAPPPPQPFASYSPHALPLRHGLHALPSGPWVGRGVKGGTGSKVWH